MGRADTFEDLLVWQKALELVARVYEACRVGELSKDWGLRGQMQRAAVSILANIAEGYERESRKEYIQFLSIGKGSAGETRCLVRVATRLAYFSDKQSAPILEAATEVSRMLKGLIDSLKTPR